MGTIRGLRWYILALMGLGTVVNYVDRNTLGVLAPVLKESLHFTTEQYSYVVSSFQICYSLMQPIAGFITDLIGLRIGYFVFALLWGTAAGLHGLAGSWQIMAACRGLLGISEAAAIPSGVKTSTMWFPPRERSMATGWFNTGSSVGAMVAPPLVIWLSLNWGWQTAFFGTGLLGIGMSVLWLVLYRNPREHPRLGAAERAVIDEGRQVDAPPRRPSPGRVLKKRQFWGMAVARFLTEPAWQTFGFWIPLYMVSVRGMDIKQFALFAWLPFLAADLGCVFGGYLSPFVARRFSISLARSRIVGIGIGCFCMIGPAFVGLVATPVAAILLFSVGAFAHQMLSSLLYALVTDLFEPEDVATATGFGGMFGYLGGAGFSLIIGQLANTLGYEPLFICLSAFDIVAFVVVATVMAPRNPSHKGVWGTRGVPQPPEAPSKFSTFDRNTLETPSAPPEWSLPDR